MESTLAYDYDALSGHIGHYLGYGRGEANGEGAWTTSQLADIKESLVSAQAQFYTPPILPNERVSYEWSFLRPTITLTLASGASTVALPDEFVGMSGPLNIVADTAYLRVPIGNVGRILALESEYPSNTGRPKIAAVEWLKMQTGRSQRAQLRIFPTADADYTLRFRMDWQPNAVTAEKPFPYGGAAHAETMRAACLAAAEFTKDEAQGPRYAYFMQRVAISVSIDRRYNAQDLGMNMDYERTSYPLKRFETIEIYGETPE